MQSLAALIVPIIIVVGVALLIDWVVGYFLPVVREPVRIIIGIIVLVWLVTKLLPLLGA